MKDISMMGFRAYQLLLDPLGLCEELLLSLAPAVPGGLVLFLLILQGLLCGLHLTLQLQFLLDQQLFGFPQLYQLLNAAEHQALCTMFG